MRRFATWTVLSATAILWYSTDADAGIFRRRGGGCHGCNGGYSSCQGGCQGGCHGGVMRGCNGGCHGCQGGRVSYYYPPAEQVPAPAKKPRNGFEESSVTGGMIDFRAPADAQIWVDGQLVERQGEAWRFMIPEGRTGRQSYEVKARWRDNGRDVNQTRNVSVDANGRMTVDFTRPAGNQPSSQPQLDNNNQNSNQNDLKNPQKNKKSNNIPPAP